jgi:hypothetical protein
MYSGPKIKTYPRHKEYIFSAGKLASRALNTFLKTIESTEKIYQLPKAVTLKYV